MAHKQSRGRSLLQMIADLQALDKRIVETVLKEYPVGRKVQWLHGHYWREGVIEGHGGSLGIDRLSFRIRTPTGKLVWIDAYRVLDADGRRPRPISRKTATS